MAQPFMKKILCPLLFALLSMTAVQGQKISGTELRLLQKKEDTLQQLARKLIVDSLPQGRMRNDSLFIRTLVRTLQVKNSFYYPKVGGPWRSAAEKELQRLLRSLANNSPHW